MTNAVNPDPESLADAGDPFFDVSIDMLCCLDFSGYFKKLNPAWERALGFSREELMSRPFIEFVHPDDRERTLNQNADVRGGGHALGFENRYVCKDGTYRWLHWNAAAHSPGQMIYSAARDVTARKAAEEEREQLVQQLQAALAEVRSLQAILPICSYCRKVRDDENDWHTVEGYLERRTNTSYSHGICPDCYTGVVLPEIEAFERDAKVHRA
jgi:PAS domain S-box-containing protein